MIIKKQKLKNIDYYYTICSQDDLKKKYENEDIKKIYNSLK